MFTVAEDVTPVGYFITVPFFLGFRLDDEYEPEISPRSLFQLW